MSHRTQRAARLNACIVIWMDGNGRQRCHVGKAKVRRLPAQSQSGSTQMGGLVRTLSDVIEVESVAIAVATARRMKGQLGQHDQAPVWYLLPQFKATEMPFKMQPSQLQG